MTKLRNFWVGSGIALTSLLVAAAAQAEETAAAPAAAAADPDIVRLKSGGLVRGSITELIPGDSVTIVTRAGKTREFSMTEVEYAGLAAKDPQVVTPAPGTAAMDADQREDEDLDAKPSKSTGERNKSYVTVHGREAHVHLVANEPGVTFHRQAASAMAMGAGGSAYATGYERMCTAPCSVSLPAGTETFALSRDGDAPVATDPVTLPAGDSELRGRIESRNGLRVAGWLTMIGGMMGGAALAYASFSSHQECDRNLGCSEATDVNIGLLATGMAVFGGGFGVGVFLVGVPDAAKVDVNSASAMPGHSPTGARGVALTGHF